MKKSAVNPYLPSWEYIPDGEPYVFGNRVYVYGSHDRFNSYLYCLNDYVCWSAPVDDLGNWRYEGVIYEKTQDPANPDGEGSLYAPDVTQGDDGRYYLYYVLNNRSDVSVAVCSEPAGHYEFYGYVHYADGTLLGQRLADEPQFDPAVLTEGGKTYLYTGFCMRGDRSRSGAMATVLGPDMLTIEVAPVFVAPSNSYSRGTDFEGHEFFEAPSIRKHGDLYYFIYSSVQMYELCYATSTHPTSGFRYGGVIVANNDIGIDTYKPADKPMYYGGNNHGSIVEIAGSWYIFYHRHTNGSNYSRQGLAERIEIQPDGSIRQVEMTSCGLNDGPLPAEGVYSAALACNLFCRVDNPYTGGMGQNGLWMNAEYPKITQDGRDGDPEEGYILNLTDGACAGFKYFAFQGVQAIQVTTRGYCTGKILIKTAWDGPVLGSIDIGFSDQWRSYRGACDIPDGVHALYFVFEGQGSATFGQFEFFTAAIK